MKRLLGEMNEPCDQKDCSSVDYIHGHYVIPARPVPLARARHGKGRTWDTQKQTKLNAGIILDSQHERQEYFTGPLVVYITFHFEVPKSASKYKKLSLLHQPHMIKPDLSNLIKFVEDSGIGILYHDDCTISHLFCTKQYGESTRTEMSIYQLYE